jgi:hypothetical protein
MKLVALGVFLVTIAITELSAASQGGKRHSRRKRPPFSKSSIVRRQRSGQRTFKVGRTRGYMPRTFEGWAGPSQGEW